MTGSRQKEDREGDFHFSTEELFLTQGINTLTCSEVVQLWKLGVVVEIGRVKIYPDLAPKSVQ